MISKELETEINKQIAREWWSALVYKEMESYFSNLGLPGFANYFKVQALEELTHGQRFFDYVLSVGGRPIVGAIPEGRNAFSSPLDAANYFLEHEQMVTSFINNLATLAQKQNDHAAQIMLQWFITEQIEEEANANQLIANLKFVEGDGRGLLLLDREMAARVFTPPAPAAT